MIEQDKQLNTELLQKSIDYLERKGYENIKADMEGYESPKSFQKKGSDVSITPDIVAERAGKKHYFEVGIKSEEPELLKSKWKFLETFSTMKNRNFKIITHRGHYKFTNDTLAEINLNKTPIRL